MTSSSRRAMPWLLSLAAHLAALLAMGFLVSIPQTLPRAGSIQISLAGGSDTTAARGTGGGTQSRPPVVARAASRSATGSDSSVAATGPAAQDTFSFRNTGAPAANLAAPAAADVLADAASLGPSAAASPAASPEAAGAFVGGGPATQWGWEGLPRKLIRKRDPEFPTVLGAMGQEIEGEARISVAPSGVVTRVEITRGSGYIEIDASVAEALRDYLFSRVEGRADTIGTVRFRFRLEKQD